MQDNTQRGGLQTYRRILAAGEKGRFEVLGTTIRIKESDGPLSVKAYTSHLKDGGGVSYELEMGKFEKWFTDIEYDLVEVTNNQSFAQQVVMHLGYGDIVSEVTSRTEAGQIILTNSVNGTWKLFAHGDPLMPVLIAAENAQRKSIRIRATLVAVTVDTPPTDARGFFLGLVNSASAVAFDFNAAYPIGDYLLGDNDGTPMNSTTFEMEVQDTAALYAVACMTKEWTVGNATYTFLINTLEESYLT